MMNTTAFFWHPRDIHTACPLYETRALFFKSFSWGWMSFMTTAPHQSWFGARKAPLEPQVWTLQICKTIGLRICPRHICQIFSTLNICDETCFQKRAAAIESTRHVLRAKPWGNGSLNRRRSTFNIQHCCCYSYTHKYSIHVNTGHSAMQKHCNMSTKVPSTGLGSCRKLAGDQTDHQDQVCSSILITICYLENIASHVVLSKWLSS